MLCLRRIIKYIISPLIVASFLFWVYQWKARQHDQSQYHEPTNFQHMTSKLSSPIQATINLEGSQPQQAQDVFYLNARISSASVFENLNYTWRVPDHITHLSGSLTGRLARLEPDNTLELRLQFKLLRQPEGLEHPVRLILSSHNNEQTRAKYFVLTQEEKNRQQRELLQRQHEYENQ